MNVYIPSHNRALTLTTPKTLLAHGIDPFLIKVWVTPGQENSYREALPEGIEVRTGAPGLDGQRNRASAETPEGMPIVWCDDDITNFVRLQGETVVPVENLTEIWDQAFDILGATHTSLWGPSPTFNPFFMSESVKIGLYYAHGMHYGVLNRHDLVITEPLKEDYERTLLHYTADGGVVRMDFFTMKGKPVYSFAGGMQDSNPNRHLEANETVDRLMARWPALVARNRQRGGHEILLRRVVT